MDSVRNVFEVPKNNMTDCCLLLYSDFNESKLTVDLKILDCDDDSAWQCQLTADNVHHYFTNLELSAIEYWKFIKEPITSTSKSHQYWINNSEFALKGVNEESSISVDLFKIPVIPASSNELMKSMIKALINVNCRFQNEEKQLLENNKELKIEKEALQSELNKKLAEKIEFEEIVFSRFVQILNAKKEKIDELEKEINNLSKDGDKRRKLRDTNESEDIYEQDTDIEEDSDSNEVAMREEEPTTSKDESMSVRDILDL